MNKFLKANKCRATDQLSTIGMAFEGYNVEKFVSKAESMGFVINVRTAAAFLQHLPKKPGLGFGVWVDTLIFNSWIISLHLSLMAYGL